jgi:carbon-monoxide dehydrogenase small subunit
MKMGDMLIKLNVNDELYEVKVKPYWTLLRVLRDKLSLTGAKLGCGTGECGACTVLVDGKAILSCLTLAARAVGKKITTIEGLSKGNKLHPIQEAFVKNHAIQCGVCTPGMILSAKALLDENPNPTEEEVRTALWQNLCRCPGYVKPIEAILEAAEDLKKGD